MIQRIPFPQGKPNMVKREALNIGSTVPEMLKSDLAVEYHVVGNSRKPSRPVKARD